MSGRRDFLALATVAAPAAVVFGPVAAVASTQPDPVVAIYAKWRLVEDALEVIDHRCADMHSGFVERHGDVLRGDPIVYEAWKNDPLHGEFDGLREQSNALSDESTDLLDAMMATPATSAAGIHCKLLAALTVWVFIEGPNVDPEHVEYHDTMTLALLRDAARVLGGRAVA